MKAIIPSDTLKLKLDNAGDSSAIMLEQHDLDNLNMVDKLVNQIEKL